MKTINAMTREEFSGVPFGEWNKPPATFESLVIVPTTEIHDSGYLVMEFVLAGGDNLPICRLGGSDVVHLDGIGGYGKDWLERLGTVPEHGPLSSWSIDCLPKSGLLRLFARKPMSCGPALSSFEVFSAGPFEVFGK
jgi:hypothetical protein